MARALQLVVALIAWGGLLLQYVLMLKSGEASAGVLTLRFFSYFTILTNLLVALSMTVPTILPASGVGRFFARSGTRAAIAVSIAIVGIIYALLLAHVWNPAGWQKVADIALHRLTPPLYVLWWLVCAEKTGVGPRSAVGWLAYPLAYCGWTLLHGALTGFYPYWFIDAGTLGWPRTLLNGVMVLAAFLAAGLLVGVAARRADGRKRLRQHTK